MSRPLRLEFPGALYHVTARGNRLAPIYRDENDRRAWIAIVRETCTRFNFKIHAYCQMTNHFHLLLETPDANLARGMRHMNGLYSQQVNRRHGLVGHLFQGRYKAILIQKERHLLELARYVVLNPVRAGIVDAPEKWNWSSYHWTASAATPPPWLHTQWLLGQFADTAYEAAQRYRRFVREGLETQSPLRATKYQLILGDVAFAAQHRDKAPVPVSGAHPRGQRRQSAMSLGEYRIRYSLRDEAMARAFWSTAFTMAQIGAYFRVSSKTVGRAVRSFETALRAESYRP